MTTVEISTDIARSLVEEAKNAEEYRRRLGATRDAEDDAYHIDQFRYFAQQVCSDQSILPLDEMVASGDPEKDAKTLGLLIDTLMEAFRNIPPGGGARRALPPVGGLSGGSGRGSEPFVGGPGGRGAAASAHRRGTPRDRGLREDQPVRRNAPRACRGPADSDAHGQPRRRVPRHQHLRRISATT
jgi:hypothetical protein